ncbi:MAG: tRNA (N(6)-L-threonylcarbamoyladenosine(37)-C(2))-methylthiotransferase MtaB [Treponema sp.]|nr:tRNA (N(6)-L-threonylcarbamoyladenosine(37)-C(2))-methylthiotransferase MtaB [Treponema sp.]
MPAFLIKTLGCKLNQLESEAVADAFFKAGFKEFVINKHDESGGSDCRPIIIVINTCTVTSKADQKARREIRKALRDYPFAQIIVTGCYAQLNRDDILKLETNGGQRLVVIGKDKIIDFIRAEGFNTPPFRAGLLITGLSLDISHSQFQFNPVKFSRHTRSFLKIQDGCDKSCTYCKIRLARGKSVSLEPCEVLSRLRILEENHAEAVLTGVNICQYQGYGTGDWGLTELLDYLLSGTEKILIRLSSLAPGSVSNVKDNEQKLVKILSHPRIQPHFHLSVQSCSGKILDRMGRAYDAGIVESAVSLLRGAKDDPFIACDIIAGFPGETEKEFIETYNICRKLDFAWIHVFPFSKREGTAAFSFTGNVPESEVTQRVKLFSALAKHGKKEYVRRWLGKETGVLIEEKAGYCYGTSMNYLKLNVMCNDIAVSPGAVLRCRLTKEGNYRDYDAAAEPVNG